MIPYAMRSRSKYSDIVSTLPRPFCSVSRIVCSSLTAMAFAMASLVCVTFGMNSTRSAMPASAALVVAFTATLCSFTSSTDANDASLMSRPFSRQAVMCASYGSRKHTSSPAIARYPPMTAPVAPAPTTTIFIFSPPLRRFIEYALPPTAQWPPRSAPGQCLATPAPEAPRLSARSHTCQGGGMHPVHSSSGARG